MGSIEAPAVGGVWLSLTLEEIDALAVAAVSGGGHVPAVGGDLKGGLQGDQRGMNDCRLSCLSLGQV